MFFHQLEHVANRI